MEHAIATSPPRLPSRASSLLRKATSFIKSSPPPPFDFATLRPNCDSEACTRPQYCGTPLATPRSSDPGTRADTETNQFGGELDGLFGDDLHTGALGLVVGSPPPCLSLSLPYSPDTNTFLGSSILASFTRSGQRSRDSVLGPSNMRHSFSLDKPQAESTLPAEAQIGPEQSPCLVPSSSSTEQPTILPPGLDVPFFVSPIDLSTSFMPALPEVTPSSSDMFAQLDASDTELVDLSLSSTMLSPPDLSILDGTFDPASQPQSSPLRQRADSSQSTPMITVVPSMLTAPTEGSSMDLSPLMDSIDELNAVQEDIGAMSTLSDSLLGGLGELLITPSATELRPAHPSSNSVTKDLFIDSAVTNSSTSMVDPPIPRSQSTSDALAQLLAVSKELDAMEHLPDVELNLPDLARCEMHQSFYASLGVSIPESYPSNPLDRVFTPPPQEFGHQFDDDDDFVNAHFAMFNGVEVPSIVVTKPDDNSPRFPASPQSVYSCDTTSLSPTLASGPSNTLTHQVSLPTIGMLAPPLTDARGRVPIPRPASVPCFSSNRYIASDSNSWSSGQSWASDSSSDFSDIGYVSMDFDGAVQGDPACPAVLRDGFMMCACDACKDASSHNSAPIDDEDSGIGLSGEPDPAAAHEEVDECIDDAAAIIDNAAPQRTQVHWLDSIDDDRTYGLLPSSRRYTHPAHSHASTTAHALHPSSNPTPFSPTHPSSSPTSQAALRFSSPTLPLRSSSPTPSFRSAVSTVQERANSTIRRVFSPSQIVSPTFSSPPVSPPPPRPVIRFEETVHTSKVPGEGVGKTVKHKPSFLRRMFPMALPSNSTNSSAPTITSTAAASRSASTFVTAESGHGATATATTLTTAKAPKKKRSFLALIKTLTFPKGNSNTTAPTNGNAQGPSTSLPPPPPQTRKRARTTSASAGPSSMRRKKSSQKIEKETIGSPRPLSSFVPSHRSPYSPSAPYDVHNNATGTWNGYRAALGSELVGGNPITHRRRAGTYAGIGHDGRDGYGERDRDGTVRRMASNRSGRAEGQVRRNVSMKSGGVNAYSPRQGYEGRAGAAIGRSGSKASRTSVAYGSRGYQPGYGGADRSLVVDARIEPTRMMPPPVPIIGAPLRGVRGMVLDLSPM